MPARRKTPCHCEERERVGHDRGSGEMGEVAAKAERDRGDGEQIRGQHQPARQEADPRSERERSVLELGRILRPHRAQPRVRVRGQAGGHGRQEEGKPQRIARQARGRADERVHSGPEDDADPGYRNLPESERSS